jgi:hypothetical protein
MNLIVDDLIEKQARGRNFLIHSKNHLVYELFDLFCFDHPVVICCFDFFELLNQKNDFVEPLYIPSVICVAQIVFAKQGPHSNLNKSTSISKEGDFP